MIPAAQHDAIVDQWLIKIEEMSSPENKGIDPEDMFLDAAIAIARQFPGVAPDDIAKALQDAAQRRDEQFAVQNARLERLAAEVDQRTKAMFEGLPADLTFDEVVKIRADQGHPYALWLTGHPEALERELDIPPA
jgi:hypothetical protein